MKKTELKIRTATCLILHTVAGIAGITALFLPFVEDISPASFIFNIFAYGFSNFLLMFFLPLAIPFFLSVFVSAAFLRWMISGLLSRTERAIAYVMSSMMAFSTLYFITFLLIDAGLPSGYGWLTLVIQLLPLVIPLLTLLFGVYVVIKNLRNKGSKEVSAVMAMQIAYLYNALLCLMLFLKNDRWQIGAYLVAVTCFIYLIQIGLASVKLRVFRRGGTNSAE